MFTKGFEKTAIRLSRIGSKAGRHLARHRKDYLMGAAAVGSLGTAYGANKSKELEKDQASISA